MQGILFILLIIHSVGDLVNNNDLEIRFDNRRFVKSNRSLKF